MDVLDDPGLTVSTLLRARARMHPDRAAVRYAGRTITYVQLDTIADTVAACLLARGLGAGSRIAWIGRNSDSFALAAAGVARANMVLVPLNWRLSLPEIVAILEDSGAGLVLATVDEAVDLATRLAGTFPVLAFEPDAQGRMPDWIGPTARDVPVAPTSASTAILIYTSGTTGRPKGVVLSHRNVLIVNQMRRDTAWENWREHDVCLLVMPFGHLGGYAVLLRCWFFGGTVAILPEFDAGEVLSAIASMRISKIALVPAMIKRLLDHPAARSTDFSSLDLIFYGTAPIEPELLREAAEVFGCGFSQGYGASETGGGLVVLSPEDHRRPELLEAAGRPMPGVEIRIDAEGAAHEGAVGEVLIRSEGVMRGYWQRPDECPIDADGWYHTGDAGLIDGEGYLFIKGRVKDMIVSGGANVYPVEVENVLYQHEGVADVAVIGVPDPDWGEAVAAFVVPAPGHAIDSGALIGWAKQRIARYKAPRQVFVVETLPRNATGKVLKAELRKPFWEGRGRQVS